MHIRISKSSAIGTGNLLYHFNLSTTSITTGTATAWYKINYDVKGVSYKYMPKLIKKDIATNAFKTNLSPIDGL